MLRISISAVGAWGRGTQFAVFSSIALGLRNCCLQTEAMPQFLLQITLFCLPQPQAPVIKDFKERNIKKRKRGAADVVFPQVTTNVLSPSLAHWASVETFTGQ
jgi:hypothetical protein